ncbi:MAG: DUF5723 family protein [Prolixibacteraceae bacterium]|nr:DUF5723 family protein [Prolixibacteraceae bacterium]
MADIRIRKTDLILIFFIFSILNNAPAQETGSLNFLPGISQSSLLNPAYQNKDDKLVIGIPLLSGIYGNWNFDVPLNTLFSKNFDYNLNNFYNALPEIGKINTSAGISLFFTSFRHNEYTFSLSVTERAFAYGKFNREIVRLIRDGIQNLYGTNEYFGSASAHFQYFREVAPSVSKMVWDNLSVGLRVKILFGRLYFSTENMDFSVETDTETGDLLIKPEGSFNLSGPFRHQRDTIFNFSSFSRNITPGDYFFRARNMGLGLDAGFIFSPDKYSEVSVSILDIGFTGFRNNTFEADIIRPVQYSKNSLYQSYSNDKPGWLEPREAMKRFSDSISYIINVDDEPYRHISYLPLKLNISGKFRISEKLGAGLASQLIYQNRNLSNLLSFYLRSSDEKKIQLAGGLSIYNFKRIMPGIGASYTRKKSQIYLSTNNISGIINPGKSKNLNLCFGINFLFETKE